MIYIINILLLFGLNVLNNNNDNPIKDTNVSKTSTEQLKPCPVAGTEKSAKELNAPVESTTIIDRDWRFRYKQNKYRSPKCPDGYLVVCNNSGQNCSSVIMPTCFDWPDKQ